MNITEMIKQLEELREKHEDLPVFVCDEEKPPFLGSRNPRIRLKNINDRFIEGCDVYLVPEHRIFI